MDLTHMQNFELPSGAKPIENTEAFAHQAVTSVNTPFVSPWPAQPQAKPAAPIAAPIAAPSVPTVLTPLAPAPALSTPIAAPMESPHDAAPQKASSGIAALPNTHQELKEFAEFLSKSSICPAVLRNPADVFILLAKAQSIGMAWPDAFTNLYAIPNGQTGEIKISMYVKTKEGVCRKYGQWDSEVDLTTGTARAWGVRYSDGQKLERTYSGFDAGLRGVLTKDANGNIIGVKRWANNWPDMLRARAVGRLLDALFPDVIGGFTSYEELTDLQYEAELNKASEQSNEPSKSKADELLSKTRRTKKAPKVETAPAAPITEAPQVSSLDSLITDDNNPLL